MKIENSNTTDELVISLSQAEAYDWLILMKKAVRELRESASRKTAVRERKSKADFLRTATHYETMAKNVEQHLLTMRKK